MNTQEIIKNFTETQQSKGFKQEDIDKTLFMALNMASAQTLETINKINPEFSKKVSTELTKPGQPINDELLNKLSNDIVGSSGEKFIDIYNKALKSILDQL